MTRFERFLKENPRVTIVVSGTIAIAVLFIFATAQVMHDSAKITMVDYEENYYYSGDDIYICEAYPGNTDPAEDYWRIKKIKNFNTDTPDCGRWANGSNEFRHVAEDYATYTYANEI